MKPGIPPDHQIMLQAALYIRVAFMIHIVFTILMYGHQSNLKPLKTEMIRNIK
jgi:hypothetical protein